MTEDFEGELRRRLNERVAGMPGSYDAAPALLARARRRRSAKLGALAATVVIVGAGTAAAVVQVAGRQSTHRLATNGAKSKLSPTTVPSPTTPGVGSAPVPTVACPISSTRAGRTPKLSTEPRPLAAGDPLLASRLVSFAATTDPAFVVLGPTAWSCLTVFYEDGRRGVGVFDPATSGAVPNIAKVPISIDNDFLWHGGVGSVAACSVFDDPAVVQYVTRNYPQYLPCPVRGRTVTRVDDHVSTFVDADGSRGAGWITLPSAQGGDGKVVVITCRPTGGLTAADCRTIVADFVARLDPASAAAAPATVAPAPFVARDWASTASGVVITDTRSNHLAAYDAVADRWHTLATPPLHGVVQIVATRGRDVYALGEPPAGSATTPFAVVNLASGKWRSLAPLPDVVYGDLQTSGDADHVFGFAATDSEVQRQIEVEYDFAAGRWTKLPAAPLSTRVSEAMQWTGRELLIWGGGDAHQGGIPADTDGAAFDPATGKWRMLPPAPVPGRLGAANVWTGTKMLIWGGADCGGCGPPAIGEGAAYDPATNQWTPLSTSPLRATYFPPAVWTGKEMIVGGRIATGAADVAAYDPAADAWRVLPAAPASVRGRFRGDDVTFAGWTGRQAIFGVVAQSTGADFAAFAYPIGG